MSDSDVLTRPQLAPFGLPSSATSWGAIVAGAVAAAALSLILILLGMGLGFATVSPWANSGASATTLGVSAIIWIAFTQLAASALGGYLAGRLRTKWRDTAQDEVYFRDTAHGFLAWSVATLLTATLTTSVIGAVANTGVQAAASLGGNVAGAAVTAGAAAAGTTPAADKDGKDTDPAPLRYFVDSLFRRDAVTAQTASTATTSTGTGTNTNTNTSTGMSGVNLSGFVSSQNATDSSAEVGRIFAVNLRSGALRPEDQRYLGQLVAQRTNLSQQEAERRVTETYARLQDTLKQAETSAKEAADKARKASAYTSLWLFITLLAGAFVASWTATVGGRQRDL